MATKNQASNRAAAARKNAEDTAAEMSQDLKSLRDDVDALLQDIGAYAKAEAKVGGEAAKEAGEVAVDEAERAVAKSRDYIRENPVIACAAALGVGFVAATLARR